MPISEDESDEEYAYYYLELLMKRFKQIVKFGHLRMTAIKNLPQFIDRIRDCVAEIRSCYPSQVPIDEQTAIRAKA